MDADRRVDGFMAIRQADSGFEIRRTFASADDHHALDSCGQGTVDCGLPVGIELGIVQVAVTIDHLLVSEKGDRQLCPLLRSYAK